MLAGRAEVGTVGTDLLVEEVEGPRVLLLAGRSWEVTHVDWQRHRCFVVPVDAGGRAKWSGFGSGVSFEIARGMRSVLIGHDPAGVRLTQRAVGVLRDLRASFAGVVDEDALVVALPADGSGRWWTWAGTAANRTLQASLPRLVDPRQRIDEQSLRLLPGVTVQEVGERLTDVVWRRPLVNPSAIAGLKFSAALPSEIARDTLAVRLDGRAQAEEVVGERRLIARS